MSSRVYIGLGSNVGDRLFYIQEALTLLKSKAGIDQVAQTAFLYQSSPMYFTDQDMFLNTCAELIVSVTPIELLTILKHVEEEIGRDKSQIRNGPRCIDLDILFFDNRTTHSSALVIPHSQIAERLFVLMPLNDICPHLTHPVLDKSVSQIYAELLCVVDPTSCIQVIPCRQFWGTNKPNVMGILNCTPDSFSDQYADEESAMSQARFLVANGADIIDVGGESTNPRAVPVEELEEQRRVISVIKRIRAEFPNQTISIDTYKASTARLAVEAGATIVNDVSGGLMDPRMIPLVADLKVPYICMHAGKIGSFVVHDALFDNVENEFIALKTSMQLIKDQITARINACMAGGIYRWNIWLDPGLGFGKNANINFAIINNWDEMFLPGYPLVFGASRKRFVRDIGEGKEWTGGLEEALVGTIAVTVNVATKQRWPNFHRVHDVACIKRTLKLVDRLTPR